MRGAGRGEGEFALICMKHRFTNWDGYRIEAISRDVRVMAVGKYFSCIKRLIVSERC